LQKTCHEYNICGKGVMPYGWKHEFLFYAQETLNWLLNIAIFGLLYLIVSKVVSNLPSLLNIITI
jgi:hypothetical protein